MRPYIIKNDINISTWNWNSFFFVYYKWIWSVSCTKPFRFDFPQKPLFVKQTKATATHYAIAVLDCICMKESIFRWNRKKTRTLTKHSTETRTNATKKKLLLIKQIAEMKEFIIMAKRAFFVVLYNTMGKQSSCNLPIPNWFCLTTTNAHKNEKAHAIHRVSRHRFFICWYSFQLFWQANRKSQQ